VLICSVDQKQRAAFHRKRPRATKLGGGHAERSTETGVAVTKSITDGQRGRGQLTASAEAARSAEHGRGDEVRKTPKVVVAWWATTG
jgi:hypothetical protein